MSTPAELYQIADELRAIASLGLSYSENIYDRERFEKVLRLSAHLIGLIENRDSSDVVEKFQDNLDHLSPLLGADAAVFQDNKLLLIQRSDNKLWALPGGLVDVGETLAEATLRELREETGLQGKVKGLLGIFDSRIWKSMAKAQLYHVIIQVEVGDQRPGISNETLAANFFAEEKLPPLSPGHKAWIPLIFKLYRGEILAPFLDGLDESESD